jgi:hypothetical protein
VNAPSTELTCFKYEERANLHRPSDQAALAGEIKRLHQGGLKPLDVAQSLRLNLDVVVNVLAGSP